MGTSDETLSNLAAFMFADDLEAAPPGETSCYSRVSCWYLPPHSKAMFGAAGGPAWPPGDSSFVSTPTWASLQQEQAGQHNFEQLLQTNLELLPDFPEFDVNLVLPEAEQNGSREAASKADSDVKPCFKTSNKTRNSNRRAQQVRCLLSCSLHLVARQPLSPESLHCSRSTECASSGFSSFVAVTCAICLPLLPWMAARACNCPSASEQPRLPAYASHCSWVHHAAKQPSSAFSCCRSGGRSRGRSSRRWRIACSSSRSSCRM